VQEIKAAWPELYGQAPRLIAVVRWGNEGSPVDVRSVDNRLALTVVLEWDEALCGGLRGHRRQ